MIVNYLYRVLGGINHAKKDIGVLILFFALPFSKSFINATIVGIILYSFYIHLKEKRWFSFKFHWFLPLLFCYFLISVLIFGGSWSLIERRLTLIIIPIIFALNLNYFQYKLRDKIYISFVGANILATIICVIRAFIRAVNIVEGKIFFDAKVLKDTDYDFMTSSIMGGNYFFSSELSYFLDSTYFALYIVFSQVLIIELLKKNWRVHQKRILIFCYFFLFVPLFLLSSKAGIFCSLIILLYFILSLKTEVRNKLIFLCSLWFIIIMLFLLNPRIKVFMDTIGDTISTFDPKAKYGHSLRILSWDASLEIIKSNWLVGVGEGNKESKLLEMYQIKGYDEPAKEMHNSHNQYLDFLLGGGVIGLGIFLCGLISLNVFSFRTKNFLLIAFIFVFSFAALFENLLTRYSGNLFFAVFVTLLLGMPKKSFDYKQIAQGLGK